MLKNVLKNLATPEYKLLDWNLKAFNDLTWNRHDLSGSSPLQKTQTRYIPSIAAPERYWLVYHLQVGQLIWNNPSIIMQSSKDKVQLDITRTVLGSDKLFQIKVNDGPIHLLEQKNRKWILFNQTNAPLANWLLGTEQEAIGDVEGPHYYNTVEVNGQPLAELIVPSIFTATRFLRKSNEPLLRNVSMNLNNEQEKILLIFLTLQLYLI